MSKAGSDWNIYKNYVKTLKAVDGLNPLYVITFDNWIEDVIQKNKLPKLTLLQRARILILTSELHKEFYEKYE